MSIQRKLLNSEFNAPHLENMNPAEPANPAPINKDREMQPYSPLDGLNKSSPARRVTGLQVNQPRSHFAITTHSGFATYEINTLKPFIRHTQLFGYDRCAMCEKTNVVILVPSNGEGQTPSSMIQFWNDIRATEIKTINVGRPVLNLVSSRELAVPITNNSLHIYNISTFQFYGTIETYANPHGAGDIAWPLRKRIVACPGDIVGQLRIYYIDQDKSVLVAAHTRPITCIKISDSGALVATASEKGTVIRLFETETGKLHHEFRRGVDQADIHSLAFHPSGKYLLVSSSKGTVHVYALERPNTVSMFSGVPLMPSYFQSKWSFCQYHVGEGNSSNKIDKTRTVCTFSESGKDVIVITDTGLHYTFPFIEDAIAGAVYTPVVRQYPI